MRRKGFLQNPKVFLEVIIIGVLAGFSAWLIDTIVISYLGFGVSQYVGMALTTISFYLLRLRFAPF